MSELAILGSLAEAIHCEYLCQYTVMTAHHRLIADISLGRKHTLLIDTYKINSFITLEIFQVIPYS